jgi:hypothetical protein
VQIIKSDFAHKIGVHMRDLRIVFQKPTNPERAEGAIFVNEDVILFALEGLQIVFSKDEPLVFNHDDSPLSITYTTRLREYLVTLRNSAVDADEIDRYCLEAFDIALITVCDHIYNYLNEVARDPVLIKTLASKLDDYGAKDIVKLSKLVPIKEKLRQIRKRCATINSALENFVVDDTVLRTCILCPRSMMKRNQKNLFAFEGSMRSEDLAGATMSEEEDEEEEMEFIFLEDLINQPYLDFDRASTQAATSLESIANQEGLYTLIRGYPGWLIC